MASPPPPLPSPPLHQFAAPSEYPVHRDPSSSLSFAHSSSLLIIAAILVFVVITSTSISIHLLLRFLSASAPRRALPPSRLPPSLPLIVHRHPAPIPTPSCPLYRSSITLSAFDLPPQSQLSPAVASEDHSKSSSFRIEIGSVSR